MPSHLSWLRGKNIHVVGLAGTEGSAVVDFLLSRGIRTLTAHDLHRPGEFDAEYDRTHQWLEPIARQDASRRLQSSSITIRWRDRYLAGIERADVVFVPQSWFRYAENAPLRALHDRGVPFSSMTHLFFEECPCAIIGVSGTNGKFTVAFLVHQMLARSGVRAFFSGNDRSHVPMLYFLDQIRPVDWLVLEISNRQLIDLPYSPHIGVLTNIVPHHLDDHGTMEAYVAVKANLLRHQGPRDLAVLNADNPHTAAMAARARHPHLFSRVRRVIPGAFVQDGAAVVARDGLQQSIPLSVLQLPGVHAVENALAAVLAASLAGASAPAMVEILSEFTGLPYRFRLVDEIGGVRYYEDSLATNPSAAAAAIEAMDRPFVLIAGGVRPQAAETDFTPMRQALDRSPVRGVMLIGTTAELMGRALAGLRVPVHTAGTLEDAVDEARALAGSGQAVLLSPGCESFDQFTDYRQRGDRFVASVRKERRGPSHKIL